MKQNPFFAGLPLAALLLTGCIDNKYDLDDIDTTTEIKVYDLVLPVNFDVVTLSDIITIDEDSKIKEIEIVESSGKCKISKFYGRTQI